MLMMATDTKRIGNLSYYTKKILGEGSFGTVYEGTVYSTCNDEDNKAVAVKRLPKRHGTDESAILREVDLMKKAKHPNILDAIAIENTEDYLFIATELCKGTLEDYVNAKYQGPRFQNEREILRQVTQGLAHLHSLKIVHRDIKPSNILVFVLPDSLGAKPQMKLADLGISKVLNADRADYTNTNATNPNGTRGWMAPEVYYSKRFDSKVDIFPLGCIFAYTLSGGKHPFGDDPDLRISRIKQKEAMKMTQQDLKDPFYSASIFKLIQAMLEVEPANRPTADAILENSFFSMVNTTTQPTGFSRLLTGQFIYICRSLIQFSATAERLAENVVRFKELINDDRVDVNAIDMTTGFIGTVMSPLLTLLCLSSDHPNLIELIQLLIEKGADVNAKGYRETESALHCLCANDRLSDQTIIKLVQLLLQNGAQAQVNLKARQSGLTPFHILCRDDSRQKIWRDNLADILLLLIQNGADVDARDCMNETPLLKLCRSYTKEGLIHPVQLLIKNGVDVNAKANNTFTPLLYLCRFQSDNEKLMDVIRLLIEEGANVRDKSDDGRTPLHELCENYKKAEFLLNIVKLMIEKGADINATDNSGKTPLMILSERRFQL